MQHLWLIPVLPLLGFVINGLFGRRSKALVNVVAIGSVLLSALVAFGWSFITGLFFLGIYIAIFLP